VTDLFYRFGVKSITMDDVARHLAISKKTLYRYFVDKNDMVYQCCLHDLEKRKAALATISEKALDARARACADDGTHANDAELHQP